MRYLIVLIAVLYCDYANAQVVVKPNERPIYIRIESSDTQQSQEVTAPSVESGEADRIKALEAEVAELKRLLQFQQASQQIEIFKPEVKELVTVPSFTAYPTRAQRQNWNMGGIPLTNSNLIKHLMGEIGSPQHGGKFNRDYLNYLATLPDGNSRLRALHSDDHDHVVRWDYVGGKPEQTVAKPVKAPTYCPTGKCPNVRWIIK